MTCAAGGIGLALAERFARAGLHVVLADVDESALEAAAAAVGAHGVETLCVRTDVRDEVSVQALAAATLERFGAVDVLCNNAGVAGQGDAWFGPLSTWEWVLGVNLYGVVHGVRAFLPTLMTRPAAHIVNTASIAGLVPGFSPAYDASKHAVVAMTEDLYSMMAALGLPVGVSVLCPGWVRTGILDSERNWPADLGDKPDPGLAAAVTIPHVRRAIDEGTTPAAVADLVAGCIEENRFWVFPQDEFLELAIRRWHTIAERQNPEQGVDVPGLPPAAQLAAEVAALLMPPAE